MSEDSINVLDYAFPQDVTEERVLELLQQPLWRICNIYSIKDAEGKEVRFIPNKAQCRVLHAIYIKGWHRILIPKARQLGFSTLFAIIALDETHFSTGKQASIVDQTQADASEKLGKVQFAWERLPKAIRDEAEPNNGKEIGWSNGSRVVGGMRARGGTNQILWISEWGPIAYDDPARSQEIATGAIPSASGTTAKVFGESTHKGGKGGDWYDMIKRSLETPEEYRTNKDFRVMFFPWHDEPRYRLKGDNRQIDADTHKYYEEILAKHGIALDDEQKLFYFKEKQRLKRDIYREFPSVIEECWLSPTPGLIYSKDVDLARSEGRISTNVLKYDGLPVYASFDIGAPQNTKVWIFQVVGDAIKFLECLTGSEECATPAAWVKRLKDIGHNWGTIFLPHDGETLWRRLMLEAGMGAVICLPRSINEWDNINDTLSSFKRCYFNSMGCEKGLDALEAFRAKEEADGISIRNVPVHDWASHASTAFGYAHQAIRLGLLANRAAMPRVAQVHKPRVIGGLRRNDNKRYI